jgi:hypothetical protein
VSGWDPGQGDHDTVTFGPEDRPSSAVRVGLVAGAAGLAAGLVVGLLVAAQDWQPMGRTEDPNEPVVVAGSVEMTGVSDQNGPGFVVQLFNGGDESVTVTGLVFDDLDSDLVGVRERALPVGEWTSFPFSAPPDCAYRVPSTMSSVRVTQSADGQVVDEDVALPDGAETLLDYHELMCAPVSPRAQDLVGLWVLEEGYPPWGPEGFHLWRFEPDGSFSADNEGGLLGGVERGLDGTYSLRNERLLIDVTGGYWCGPGQRAVWRPSLLDAWGGSAPGDQPVLAVEWLHGYCPDDADGTLWVMRRIIDRVD